MSIPIKALPDPSGDTNALAEFTSIDSIPVANGGTGALTAPSARTNLGAASQADHTAHLGDTGNPHVVTAVQVGAIPTAEKGVANGVAPLNALNEIPLIHIPSAAIPEVDVVANAAARIALIPSRQEGDSLFQTDDSSTWKHDGTTYISWSPQEIFGSQFEFLKDDAVSTTLSTTYQDKVLLATAVVPAGTYKIEWSYQYNCDSTTQDYRGRLRVDGTDIMVHRQELKDSAGTFGGSGSNQQYQSSGFDYLVLTNASHDILLQWRTQDTGVEASIWNARISIHRVS